MPRRSGRPASTPCRWACTARCRSSGGRRLACRYGVLPCNGLLYVTPHQCFCYPGVKITGFNALAPRGAAEAAPEADHERLERGSAYGAKADAAPASAADWPTHRCDARRRGATGSAVPADVRQVWQVALGGRLSQPTVAAGRLLVASVDTHTVHALNAADGKPLWTFTAGGRVDSAPTIHGSLALFGSADGWVYCLRAADGALVWRFRGAPRARRVVSYGQLESAWPIHGSVLVTGGAACFAAGRSSFLDGGIRLFALDPATGRKLHETCLDGPHPDIGKDVGRPFDMDGCFADVLVTDGEFLYMQQIKLDAALAVQDAPRITKLGDRKLGRRVFSTAGLLDGSWWNRTFWMHAETWPGYYIANQAPKAGQLLVCDDRTTYAVKCYTTRNVHSPMFFPATGGYLLVADDNDDEPVLTDRAADKDKGIGFTRAGEPKWSKHVPVRIRAMVLADKTLFVAGPPDVLDPADPLAAFEGRKGAVLQARSAADGAKIAERALPSPPVFDGLIAAAGRLYLATCDGRLTCFAGRP